MKKILFFLVVILGVAFYSCTKVNGPVPDPLKGILLGKDTLIMHVGDVEQVNFTLNPSNYDKNSLVWKSSDTTIISVTQAGTLTAKKEGSAIITVSNSTNTISVNVLITVEAKEQAVDSLKVGLIAYYAFNNSAIDSSGNNNNGTVYNAVSTTDRFGNANSAYQFDGTSSYITVPDNQALRLSGTDFTINYWVNLDEYTSLSGSAVLAKNNGPYQQGWNASITGNGDVDPGTGTVNYGHVFYNVSGGGDPYVIGQGVIPVGQWSMVTITYKASTQTITFYINGSLDISTANIPTPNPQTSVNLFIGKNSYNDLSGQTPAYYIKGKLDDIRLYGRLLSTDDISKLYNLTH